MGGGGGIFEFAIDSEHLDDTQFLGVKSRFTVHHKTGGEGGGGIVCPGPQRPSLAPKSVVPQCSPLVWVGGVLMGGWVRCDTSASPREQQQLRSSRAAEGRAEGVS